MSENTKYRALTKSDWLEKVIIRHLTYRDLPALEWGGKYKHFRRIYTEVYDRVQAGSAIMWGAELFPIGNIGQLFVQFQNQLSYENTWGQAYIHSFRIKSAYRNNGLGTKIMRVVENDLVQRNIHRVSLNVARINPAARNLYIKLGYKITQEDPGKWTYYDEKGDLKYVNEPGWRLEKILFRK